MREQALAVMLEGRADFLVVWLPKTWKVNKSAQATAALPGAENGLCEHVHNWSCALRLTRTMGLPRKLIPEICPQRCRFQRSGVGPGNYIYIKIEGILQQVVQEPCFEPGVKWAWDE